MSVKFITVHRSKGGDPVEVAVDKIIRFEWVERFNSTVLHVIGSTLWVEEPPGLIRCKLGLAT